MTDDVTEMPRSCSRRIQSDVACRVALRPLTAPAIWIAPPNSSNFSVSVVLPASGCEMMANVRLFRCSCIGGTRGKSARRRQRRGEDHGVFAAVVGLVVRRPSPVLHEPDRAVEIQRDPVRRANLEENL